MIIHYTPFEIASGHFYEIGSGTEFLIDSNPNDVLSLEQPAFLCRAWVIFNGTGTVAIKASGNVSSITDNGTGDYTVNFATAMVDTNYAVCFGSGNDTYGYIVSGRINNYPNTTSSYRLECINTSGTVQDTAWVSVSVFR